MKDPDKLLEYRFFTPADFREEQAYLEFRHRQGWAFESVRRFRYCFKREEQAQKTYVRDYKEDDIFIDDYTEMYESDGWEFIFRTDEAYYFRKDKVQYPEELEIFSTYFDRAQYYGKLQMRMMSDVFVVVLIAVLCIVAAGVAGSFAFSTFVDGLIVTFSFLLLFISALVLLFLYIKYRKIMQIELTPAEKRDRAEGSADKGFASEVSKFGQFTEADQSFEELLNGKIESR